MTLRQSSIVQMYLLARHLSRRPSIPAYFRQPVPEYIATGLALYKNILLPAIHKASPVYSQMAYIGTGLDGTYYTSVFLNYLPHPQTQLTPLAQKIPFINSEKKILGCQQCAQKY